MTTNDQAFPWMTSAERVYGPLADAFGLRPARDVLETWCELAAAQFAEFAANAQVAGVMAGGALDGMNRLTSRLDGMRSEGRSIDSPTVLLRLGLGEVDAAMHAAMLSDGGLAATAASVRASSRRRGGWRKLGELAAEAAGQPTQAEVDEVCREIQQLKRELRALKRAEGCKAIEGSRT